MLPLLKPLCIQDAVIFLSKLSGSESESIVFSGVWTVLGLLLFLPAANAVSESREVFFRTKARKRICVQPGHTRGIKCT